MLAALLLTLLFFNSPGETSANPTTAKFLDWLEECGAKSSHLKLHTSKKDGGPALGELEPNELLIHNLRATGQVKEKEVLFQIPYDCCIREPGPEPLPDALRDAPWDVRLAARLHLERIQQNTSNFYPYIRLLERTPVKAPWAIFSRKEIETLQFPHIGDAVRAKRDAAIQAFHDFQLQTVIGANFTEFVWALATVSGRFLTLTPGDSEPKGAQEVTRALVPFVDAAGLKVEGKMSLRSANEGVELVAISPISVGREATLGWTAFGFERSILHFGVLAEGNQPDRFALFESPQHVLRWYLRRFGSKECRTEEERRLAEETNTLLELRALNATVAAMADAKMGFKEWASGWWPREIEATLLADYDRLWIWENGQGDRALRVALQSLWLMGAAEGYCRCVGLKEGGGLVDYDDIKKKEDGGSVGRWEVRDEISDEDLEGRLMFGPVSRFGSPWHAVLLRTEEILQRLPTSVMDDRVRLATLINRGAQEEGGGVAGKTGSARSGSEGGSRMCAWDDRDDGCDDAALLDGYNDRENLQVALRYRLEFKHMLINAVQYMQEKIDIDWFSELERYEDPSE